MHFDDDARLGAERAPVVVEVRAIRRSDFDQSRAALAP